LVALISPFNTRSKVFAQPILETSERRVFDSMFEYQMSKTAYFFYQEAGKHLHDNWKNHLVVTSLLAALTDGYSSYAGAARPRFGSTSRAPRQGIFNPVRLSVTPSETQADGYNPSSMVQETEAGVALCTRSHGDGQRNSPRLKILFPIVRFLGQPRADGIPGQTRFSPIGGYTTR